MYGILKLKKIDRTTFMACYFIVPEKLYLILTENIPHVHIYHKRFSMKKKSGE